MQTLLQDLRYAVRMLAKRPGFTAVVIFTLALGIGANSAIFSVVNTVLLRQLPFKEPEQLIKLWETYPRGFGTVSPPNLKDWREQNSAFTGIAAYQNAGYSLQVRSEVQGVDPNQPVYNIKTMTTVIDESVSDRRLNMTLLSIFAAGDEIGPDRGTAAGLGLGS